jgi:transcriptional regulator with PAS, ATPase and Fis domain
MARLDARVKTNLPAKVILASGSKYQEKRVLIKELSLGGAVIERHSAERGELLPLKLNLPDFGEIELVGEMVRQYCGGSAVKLYWTDASILFSLWKHIQGHLLEGQETCPYCGITDDCQDAICRECGLSLSFGDETYLNNHLKRTFLNRFKEHLEKFEPEHLQRLIHFTTRELLKIRGTFPEAEFVGTSPEMLQVFSMIRKVAPTDMNVLILGESGTGKELTAKAIHERSERKNRPFVAINCAAIPEGLLEAELFGYEKGAFTGAQAARKGKFEVADQGSLFLDEIGDLSPSLQAKLLRFLEDRMIERLGGKGSRQVDVRIIAATNCNLDSLMEQGRFRNDLFFRLNAFAIKLPSLRERGDDKVVLAQYFFHRFTRDAGSSLTGFSAEALDAIGNYHWPGNVREMINKIRRAMVMAPGPMIHPADLELEIAPAEKATLRSQVSQNQRDLLLKALEEHGYVISRAAKALEVSRPSIYAMVKKYGIVLPSK